MNQCLVHWQKKQLSKEQSIPNQLGQIDLIIGSKIMHIWERTKSIANVQTNAMCWAKIEASILLWQEPIHRWAAGSLLWSRQWGLIVLTGRPHQFLREVQNRVSNHSFDSEMPISKDFFNELNFVIELIVGMLETRLDCGSFIYSRAKRQMMDLFKHLTPLINYVL